MVPMRDGVDLNTIVFHPNDLQKKYDAVLIRTPYDAEGLKSEGEYYGKGERARGSRWRAGRAEQL